VSARAEAVSCEIDPKMFLVFTATSAKGYTHGHTDRCSAGCQSRCLHREQLCCWIHRQSHTICCLRG